MTCLIVVSGLPSAGKSTLARSVAAEIAALVLSKDVIEAALWRRGIKREQNSGWAAHETMTALAGDLLQQGHRVVIDSVGATEDVRKDWREVALINDARFVVIVCECSDRDVHRERLDGRVRGISGWPELVWSDVESVRARWQPWTDPHLTVDAMDDAELNASSAVAYVRR